MKKYLDIDIAYGTGEEEHILKGIEVKLCATNEIIAHSPIDHIEYNEKTIGITLLLDYTSGDPELIVDRNLTKDQIKSEILQFLLTFVYSDLLEAQARPALWDNPGEDYFMCECSECKTLGPQWKDPRLESSPAECGYCGSLKKLRIVNITRMGQTRRVLSRYGQSGV